MTDTSSLLDAIARIALALQSVDPKLHEDFLMILENRRVLEEENKEILERFNSFLDGANKRMESLIESI